jgi:hypothetical protein
MVDRAEMELTNTGAGDRTDSIKKAKELHLRETYSNGSVCTEMPQKSDLLCITSGEIHVLLSTIKRARLYKIFS